MAKAVTITIYKLYLRLFYRNESVIVIKGNKLLYFSNVSTFPFVIVVVIESKL